MTNPSNHFYHSMFLVRASEAPAANVVRASEAISAIGAMPETGTGEIQWMPPGTSEINATVNGKPKKVKATSSPQTADMVDKQIKALLAKAENGDDVRPYIDFNHEDREASGWPIAARWGGEDPKTGGVRLTIEWSDEGRASVKGKRFQSFSPEFLLGDDGNVSGITHNLGGLVNRPAFTKIQKVSAKAESDAGGTSEEENKPAPGVNLYMKQLLKVLAGMSLISSSDLDEAAAVGELSARASDVKDGLNVRARLNTEYVAKKDHDAVVTAHEALKKSNASHVVAAAMKEGRIAPKDDKTRDRFINLITLDPANAELLDSLPVTQVPEQILKGSAGDRGTGAVEGAQTSDFMTLVKAHAANNKTSETDSMIAVGRENPKAYRAYVDGLGKK